MLPIIKKEREDFVQEYLYIEEYLPPPPLPKKPNIDGDNNKNSEAERGVVIIELT